MAGSRGWSLAVAAGLACAPVVLVHAAHEPVDCLPLLGDGWATGIVPVYYGTLHDAKASVRFFGDSGDAVWVFAAAPNLPMAVNVYEVDPVSYDPVEADCYTECATDLSNGDFLRCDLGPRWASDGEFLVTIECVYPSGACLNGDPGFVLYYERTTPGVT